MTTTPPPPRHVGVALDLPIDRLFTYRVPEALVPRVAVGQRVRVPFRGRPMVGWIADADAACDRPRVEDVTDLPDEVPLLAADLLELGRFVSTYYGASLGEALAAMVPRGVRARRAATTRRRARLVGAAAEATKLADALPPSRNARARILRLLAKSEDGAWVSDVLRRARTTAQPLKTLEKDGLVRTESVREEHDPLVEAARRPAEGGEAAAVPVLEPAQRAALAAVDDAVVRGAFAAFLLLGVTGSGKTEVYLRAIETCRAAGRQAIVLVPEIALTPQTVRRFRARFARVAVLHSAMTDADRAASWRTIRAGEADVVVGPRSAVFAPVPRLGLLVVDEEHETSFKQQNAPRYHARDVGLVRAKAAGAVVVLGSATPCLESYRNALEDRYVLLNLPDRVEGRPLPPVRLVDLRADGERRSAHASLSRTLTARLRAALAAGGQAILFLNRRGFSTSVACPRCGYVLCCPRCDVSLTYHRGDRLGVCHLCGHETRPPSVCPDCAFPSLKYRGAGTQSVEEEVRATFPDARVARMDSDTMTGRDAYERVLTAFAAGEVDVLLGTQMIAKGLHFPRVTLVGVVSADTSLDLPDLRAAERTFSLLAQVAGRAGRGDDGGEVVVQTLRPDEPAVALAASHDFVAFARAEMEVRRAHGYPPFTRLLRVVVRGRRVAPVEERAARLAERLERAELPGVSWLGPTAPAVPRIAGYDRRHLLVRAPTRAAIHEALVTLRATERPVRGVEEQMDVDPVSLL